MKALILALIAAGFVGFAGAAQAGPGCDGSFSHDRTAEAPPPPPPPAPSS